MEMEITRNGVIEAYFCMITGLLLNNPAQISWPNAKAETTPSAVITQSFKVTVIAFLARSGFPAPSSFETLVLHFVLSVKIS